MVFHETDIPRIAGWLFTDRRWDYGQVEKFGSHAGQLEPGDGVQ